MLATIFTIVSLFAEPQKELQVAEDLQSHWKVLRAGRFVDYDESFTKTVYLNVDLNHGSDRYLKIQSPKEFYLFINSRLVTKSNYLMLKTDSLQETHHGHFFISIYQPEGIHQLATKLMYYQETGLYDNLKRPSRSFNNFMTLATIILFIFFTALLRSNPQLTTDYLNFVKLFSLKRRDDSQFVLRITSSVNLLFYFFCSLLASLALIVAAHSSNGLSVSFATTYMNATSYFGLWLVVTFIVGSVLVVKLFLASIISLLFGWRDTAGFQFFNFVRGLVLALSLIGLISILGFSVGINIDYYFLVKCFFVLLAANAILMFFKLLNRESTSAFHLFSYLCATEIFPLLILTKVLLF